VGRPEGRSRAGAHGGEAPDAERRRHDRPDDGSRERAGGVPASARGDPHDGPGERDGSVDGAVAAIQQPAAAALSLLDARHGGGSASTSAFASALRYPP
jgi:hypothetical protein